MAWFYCTTAALDESYLPREATYVSKKALQLKNGLLGLSYFGQRLVNLFKERLCRPRRLFRPNTNSSKSAARLGSVWLTKFFNLDWLKEFLLSIISVEHFFEVGVVPTFVEQIFNAAAEAIDKPERNQTIVSFTSTNQLLKSYMENGDSRIKFATKTAALGVRLKVIGAILAMYGTRTRYTIYNWLVSGIFW